MTKEFVLFTDDNDSERDVEYNQLVACYNIT